jgi:hypothetical protein
VGAYAAMDGALELMGQLEDVVRFHCGDLFDKLFMAVFMNN